MKYIEFLKSIGFVLQNGSSQRYTKSYNNYEIICDIENNIINYGNKIKIHRTTTSNFNQQENLVVLECVNKLLTMGYKPEAIELEKAYGSGRKEKGQFLDILLKREDETAFALIECKTFGEEHNKERIKMEKNGGQLFNYFANQKDADFLILYSCDVKDKKRCRCDIVKTTNLKNLPDTKTIMKEWDKTTESNGFFESKTLYDFQSGIRKGHLNEISYSDIYSSEDSKTNGTIFNRFAEILRRHTVSDKSNAYNKIFNLFLCKIIDEQNSNENDVLKFQWQNNETAEEVIGRLNELYKVGMLKYMELDVTDHTEEEFKAKLSLSDNTEALKMFNEIRLYKNNEFAFKEVINEKTFKENAKVVKEVIKLLERYQVKYSHKQQFLGDFFEKLLNIGVKQESGQFFTPVPIARFIVNSIPFESIINNKIQNKEREYLPKCIDYACGSGHFLTEAMDRLQKILDNNFDTSILSPEQKRQYNLWKTDEDTKTAYSWASSFIYGIEKDYRLAKTTKVSCFLNGDGEAKILYADGLNSFSHEDYKGIIQKEKFDVVIANPPFSVEDFKQTLETGDEDFTLFKENGSDDIECLFMERTAQLLNEGGIVAVILPSTVLTNEGIHAKARKLFVENFEIVAFQELFGTVFAATGNSTTVIFGRKRKKNTITIINKLIKDFTETKLDFNYNQNENVVSEFCNFIGIDFEEYRTQKLTNKDIERLKFFLLTYNQKCLVSTYENGSGNGRKEKLFLGYEHSTRKKYEGIKPFPNNKDGKINSKLYTDDNPLDETKVSSYIYKMLNHEEITQINDGLQNNVSICNFEDLINWNEENFNCYINTHNSKKEAKDSVKWKYKTEKFENMLVKVNTKSKIQLGKQDWEESGKYPIISQEREFISGYTNKEDGLISDIPLIAFGDHSLTVKYIDFPFFYGGDGLQFIRPNNEYLLRFFFYLIKFIAPKVASGKYSRHYSKLKNLQIPLPPLEIQQKIVEEIEAIEKAEKNVEREIGNFNDEVAGLIEGEVSLTSYTFQKISEELFAGGDLPKEKFSKEKTKHFNIPVFKNDSNESIFGYTNQARVLKECVTISARGTLGVVSFKDFPFFPAGRLIVLIPNNNIALAKYLKFKINKNMFVNGGTVIPQLTVPQICNIEIQLPPLEKQKEMLAKIEKIEEKIVFNKKQLEDFANQRNLILEKYLVG